MIKLALIGAGKWGRNYLDAIKNIPNAEIKYVVDSSPLPDIPQGYILLKDYHELEKKNLGGVIIAVPAFLHYEIASFFIEKGIPVLIEKPLTSSLSQALDLKRIQEKSKGLAMVGHIHRYNPAFIKLCENLSKIGKIKHIDSEGMNFGPFRDDVSALWDYGPHDISMITKILGTPVSIKAEGIGEKDKVYDSYLLKLRFADHVVSSTSIGRNSKIKKRKLTVFGEKGQIIFDDLAKDKLVIKTDKVEYPKLSNKSPLTNQILEFTDCIEKKREPQTGLSEGILVVKILDLADKSLKEGKEIKFES